jgi:hypothetical protein
MAGSTERKEDAPRFPDPENGANSVVPVATIRLRVTAACGHLDLSLREQQIPPASGQRTQMVEHDRD